MHIDKETYKIKEVNHYKNQTAKTQIVLATSLRKDNYHITRLLHKDFGKSKKWNTYTISRDGIVYQHYDNKYHTDFLGVKEGDKQTISIVLENMGTLFQTSTGKYINWLNEYCDEEFVVKREWLGYNYWEAIPDAQLKSSILLCKELCEEHNIPKICIDFQHYHKDIFKFRGITFRSNYIEDSSDINPLFDGGKFNALLKNDII